MGTRGGRRAGEDMSPTRGEVVVVTATDLRQPGQGVGGRISSSSFSSSSSSPLPIWPSAWLPNPFIITDGTMIKYNVGCDVVLLMQMI